MKKQAADKKITNTTGLDDLIVESHGTKGAYNSYGRLSFYLKYDKEKELASGSFESDKDASQKNAKKTAGGIIVIADYTEAEHDCDVQTVNKIIVIIEEMFKRKKLAGSWSIGRYLNLSYSYKENELFDENSYCVELTGIRKETLLELAKETCLMIGKDVLVKPYEDSEIIYIDDFLMKMSREICRSKSKGNDNKNCVDAMKELRKPMAGEDSNPDMLDDGMFHNNKLTIAVLKQMDKSRLVAFMYAEYGAMGSPGHVDIIDCDNNIYSAETVRGDADFELWEVFELFDGYRPLLGYTIDGIKRVYVNGDNWLYMYLGCGNHLLMKTQFFAEHGDNLFSIDPVERYGNWKKLTK